MLESHRRFLVSYLDGLVDDDLQSLWELTVGFCARQQDVRWLRAALDAVIADPAYPLVRNTVASLKDALFARPSDLARIGPLCAVFAAEDLRVLHAMKLALREGIQAFEQHEAEVIERAADQLMAALRQVVQAVRDYYRRLAERLAEHGLTAARRRVHGPRAADPARRRACRATAPGCEGFRRRRRRPRRRAW